MLVYHTTILTTAPIATIHAPALAPFPNPLEKGFLNPSLLAGILSKGFAVGSYCAMDLINTSTSTHSMLNTKRTSVPGRPSCRA